MSYPPLSGLPINSDTLSELQKNLSGLNPLQTAWLSGYLWARSQQMEAPAAASAPAATAPGTPQQASPVLILSASQTGNARRVAQSLQDKLKAAGVASVLKNTGDYKSRQLASERLVLIIASTQGDGEPPEEALTLHKALFGKKPPDVKALQFAVLGLGDSSYPDFCQAGKDFDSRLAELGAQRLFERVDCDLDYQATADEWVEKTVGWLVEHESRNTEATAATGSVSALVNEPQVHAQIYTREKPFTATILTNQKITSRDSLKDVRHLEFDLADSGIRYQPGDALGVWFRNDPALAESILSSTGIDGAEKVTLADGNSLAVRDALVHRLEITQNTPAFVKGYAQITQDKALLELVADSKALQEYITDTPIDVVLRRVPKVLTAQQLCGLLRPLTPRLYSIASAQEEVGDEVHITVALVQYEQDAKQYQGGASGYLNRRVQAGDEVEIFIESSANFRLPEDAQTSVIMIGAGTGIAPFRAFMQKRDAEDHQGSNWLIFGNQSFKDDFLYQLEWQQLAKSQRLSRYSFAWSRDQQEKVYVQHKLLQEGQQLWQWLQKGAHLYVCGDASRMAKDVEAALLAVISREGGLSADDADAYLDELRESHRYQRDVY
ncbi:sulfite reductase [NADPH] flavoprotein, alpha-component [Advenella sp. S44]|uniref:assimilatory sulfite reductase (NADPH) flavoprotein subunit n=1 Tax=Advenella sp. S44 TaxID=1982755 RepID=UPI000C2AF15B|nr:assimilatory sulfite reductase (NADPH) flavoprotein subunit [Advenella sp. S44]PJX25734.1 sulfite reductase [NADPH] flavoprotein, alpha-component [Advenella sp. S44]